MTPGALVGGRFEIERLAGAGGMADVFRARDLTTGLAVAVKIGREVRRTQPERFRREIDLVATLHHPAIVRYVGQGSTDDGLPYLVTEWLDGEDLGRQLLRSGALGVAASVALATRVAEALAAAHALGVVHRDVKPQNLLLVDGMPDRVKLLDFGIARHAAIDRMTHAGTTLGTPGYMAPEQARGDADVDPRADVFSLGCVLFECLTGRPPFVAGHPMALLAKILLEEPPRLGALVEGVPAVLEALVDRMLAKERARRPADGGAVAGELARLGPGMSIASPAPLRRSLTAAEQRLLCVILRGGRTTTRTGGRSMDIDSSAPTLVLDEDTTVELGQRAEQVEHLLDGSLVIALAAERSAQELASRAAHRALALHATLPAAPLAVAMGRGQLAGAWPMGEAIDRAAVLLAQNDAGVASGPGIVRIDDATARLLGARFDVRRDAVGAILCGERAEETLLTTSLLGRTTRFVGRAPELSMLAGLLDAVVDEGAPAVVILRGAPGVGKTRLRFELERTLGARVPDAEVWRAQGDLARAGSPFQILGTLLRGLADIGGSDAADVARDRLAARVGRHVAAAEVARVTEFLGEVALVPGEPSAAVRAARADAQLMGDQIRRAWEDFVAAECAAHPVVVLLDDLQWGDTSSLRLVDAALRVDEGRPLLVVAFGRPELKDTFPNLWSERRLTSLRLGEMSRKASAELVVDALGSNVPEETVARIVARSEGNPFCLEELVRAEVEGTGGELPGSVLAMTQVRLDALEQDARLTLRAASVFGESFWLRGVVALLGDTEEMPGVWLAELLSREWIVRRPTSRYPGEDEWAFRHGLLREAAYGMLTEADRTLGHRLALDWLEAVGERDPRTLAEHAARGDQRDRAAEHWLRAARQALTASDLEGALACAGRAVAMGITGARKGAAVLVRAEALRWLGQRGPREQALREAIELLEERTDPWYAACGDLSSLLGGAGRNDELRALARSMLAWTLSGPTLGEQVRATTDAIMQLQYAGAYDLAADLRARVPPIDTLDALGAAYVHLGDAVSALVRGDVEMYADLTETAAVAFERAGDVRAACNNRGSRGYAQLLLGRPEQAEPILRDVVTSAEGLGLLNVAAAARHNLGAALAWQGRIDEALEVEGRAARFFASRGQRRLECACRIYVAMFLLAAERAPDALVEAEAAVAVAPGRPLEAYAQAVGARALLALGRTDDALARSGTALDTLTSLGGIEEGEATVRLARAEALHASGDIDGARAVLGAAHARLVERAASFRDPAHRESFLARVPENARVIALSEAWRPVG